MKQLCLNVQVDESKQVLSPVLVHTFINDLNEAIAVLLIQLASRSHADI